MLMNKSIIAAAVVAAGLSAAPVFAANTANFGQVISSIQASKTGAMQIQSLTTVSSVNVVKVNGLLKGKNVKALDNAMMKNKTDIASLRAAMTANTTVKTALATAHVNVSTVVAANIADNGVLTVYVR